MRKCIFALLFATSLFGQHHNMHCPVLFGIQMPAGKYPAKITLYFIPPFVGRPKCVVDFGEVQTMNVTSGFVQIAGKPETRIDIRCIEVDQ